MGLFSRSRSDEAAHINACIERIARLERLVHQHQKVIDRIGRYVQSDIDTPWMPAACELVETINNIPKI